MSSSGGDAVSARGPPIPAGTVEAVVLAAGHGVRLGSLTKSTPKVLLRVDGRPLLDYHLTALAAVGVRRVVLVVSYFAEQVERHVDGGRPFGLEVTSVRQAQPRGTGHAVAAASSEVRSDPFLVCYADVFIPGEEALLRALLSDDTAKIAAARVPDAGGFGRLLTKEEDGEPYLAGIQEKDGRPTPGLVNAGVYLLPRSLLRLVAGLSPSPRGEYELTDAVREYVAQGDRIRVVTLEEWVDAGTQESLARAHELAVRARG